MTSFGNIDVFSIRLSPLAGAPEEADVSAAATWACMELWVDRRNLLEHSHETTRSVHEGINWPAIYFARWLVRNWKEFFCEQRWPLPGHWRNPLEVGDVLDKHLLDLEAVGDETRIDELLDERDRFISTRCVTAGTGGALFPELYLARDGDRFSVSWRTRTRSQESWFRQPDGEADIPAAAFVEVAIEFVSWCRAQVEGLAEPVAESDSHELGQWLDYVTSNEAAEDSLWGYLGFRPDARIVEPVARLLDLPRTWRETGTSFDASSTGVAVAFRALAPVLGPNDIVDLLTRLEEYGDAPEADQRLHEIRRALPSVSRDLADYEQGYFLARRFREYIDNTERYLDIEGLLRTWGVPIEEIRLGDPLIDGGALWSDSEGPLLFLNTASPKTQTSWGRRMVLAHELGHLLRDRNGSSSLRVVSTPWTPPLMERRANAFAAELLLPKRGVAATIGAPTTMPSDSDLNRLMRKFRVGRTTCERHVVNRFRL